MKETAQPANSVQTAVKSSPAALPILRRKCACGGTPGPSGECESCRKKRLGLQRKALGHDGPALAPDSVHEVLDSPSQSLDPATQAAMGSRFGHDFSRVHIHTDLKSAESARAVNALAYTVGNNVVFGAGQYAPGTSAGRRLLAHEMAHVVQQAGATPPGRGELLVGDSQAAEEHAADRAAESAAQPATLGVDPGIAPPSVIALRRQEEDGAPASPVMAPGNDRSFTAEGVKVTIFRRCDTNEFGMDKIESATRDALNAVFNSECISSDRRTRMQNNLKEFGGLFIFCKQPGEMHLGAERCAESTGGSGEIRLSSIMFTGKPPQFCDDLRAVILHEIVHVSLFAQFEKLPRSCEMSCFNHDHTEGAETCQNPRDPNVPD